MSAEIALPRPLALALRGLGLAAGVLLLLIILLTVADVISRNLGDRSIVGTVDITTMLLVATAYLGLASAEADGRHVSVELVEGRLGARARLAFSVLRSALLVGVGVLMTWGLTEVLISAAERGETTNDILRLPTWPAKLILLVSFTAFFVVAVWRELLTFAQARAEQKGRSDDRCHHRRTRRRLGPVLRAVVDPPARRTRIDGVGVGGCPDTAWHRRRGQHGGQPAVLHRGGLFVDDHPAVHRHGGLRGPGRTRPGRLRPGHLGVPTVAGRSRAGVVGGVGDVRRGHRVQRRHRRDHGTGVDRCHRASRIRHPPRRGCRMCRWNARGSSSAFDRSGALRRGHRGEHRATAHRRHRARAADHRRVRADDRLAGGLAATPGQGSVRGVGRCRIRILRQPNSAKNRENPGSRDVTGFLYLVVIFAVSVGTIYLGVATPTEAASFGAFAALIILLLRSRPSAWLRNVEESLREAVGLTAMTFLLMVGAGVFTYVLALSGASTSLVNAVTAADLPPYVVLVACLAVLLPLGMFLDGISMILIAAPLLHPILTGYGFDGIWIGVLVVKVAEMALITPPVGMNAFVYSGAVREAGLDRVFRGIVPFVVADLVVVALLIAFPAVVTFLPSMSGAQQGGQVDRVPR